jgi:hypothetical protein
MLSELRIFPGVLNSIGRFLDKSACFDVGFATGVAHECRNMAGAVEFFDGETL